MTMFGESHDIHQDFPQYRDMINQLHDSDSDFKNIYSEYHAITHEIDAIEHNVEPVADHYAEQLKKKRVLLKDQIYARLQASGA
ncbi:MAG TPA: GTP-binding protein [Gammaproteobacteria bacterium]|nr:GTP-binding protein [Gammaproteobacteria bacterium]